MITTDINQKFKNIHESISTWPGYIEEPNITYNIQSLYTTLARREERELLYDHKLLAIVDTLNERFGRVTEMINKNLSGPNDILRELNYLDLEVNEKLTGNYKDHVRQSGLSVRALYCYRNNEMDKAIRLSEQCIDIVDSLIQKGLSSFIFRAVEMNKNLSRVFFKIGEIQKSDSIKNSILSYHLKSCGKNSLYGTNFNDINLWSEMPYLRECFGYYYFIEYSDDLQSKDIFSYKPNRFNKLFENISNIKVDNIDRYRISEWIKIQNFFYSHQFDAFLTEAAAYLDTPIHRFYQLPIEVLLKQLILLSSESDYNNKSSLIANLETFKNSRKSSETTKVI